ncbi:hypothetical protein [Rhodoferax aquaticus]|uniref:Uncharacterized protein n=1 Tax=Rhodoferax aquaticus TaxID=2527691 RepID=A0A515EPF8_9BURK|nr:hypothetical protein [Rhodoferax aquaticus]QDL54546.1 hypothetical protein EXZ61_10425 [Rhodoferax aquaticus]
MSEAALDNKPSLGAKLGVSLAGLALVIGAGFSLYYGVRAAWPDATSLPTRWRLAEWRDGRGPLATLELWAASRDDLRAALKLEPNNPQFYEDLGYLHAVRAQGMGVLRPDDGQFTFQKILLDEAIDNYRSAGALRPTFPYPFAYFAYLKTLSGQVDDAMWAAYDRAYTYGKNEAGVQFILAQVAMPQWQLMTDDRKVAFKAMVASAQVDAKKKLLETATANRVDLN